MKWFIGAALILLVTKLGVRSYLEKTEKAQPVAQTVTQAKTVHIPKKQVFKIDLSERTINELEYDWSILSAQAEAVRELRGWRFTRVNANSPFYRAGLRAGDLITEDFLNALRGQDTAANLAYRIELILNRITR